MSDGTFKIIDFGHARQIDDLKSPVPILGTSPYLPPEISKYYDRNNQYLQYLPKDVSDNIDWYKTDIYSLGLTFLAAVGKIDFMGEITYKDLTFQKLEEYKAQNIYHPNVYEIIYKMIQKVQKNRANIDELLKLSEELEC